MSRLRFRRVISEKFVNNEWVAKKKTGLFWFGKEGAIYTLFLV